MTQTKRFYRCTLLVLILFCLRTAHAAISVGGGGVGPITFTTIADTNGWTTVSKLPNSGTSYADGAALDASSQTNTSPYIAVSATSTPVNGAVTQDTANPPATSGTARWNSALGALATRPTGNSATMLMGEFRNDSTFCINAISLSFDMASQSAATAELPGWHVYYSLSGAAGSWQLIPNLSDVVVTGNLSTNNLPLVSNWAPNTSLFLLFADDNGNGVSDPSYTIDNLTMGVSSCELTCVAITNGPASITVPERNGASFSIMATGAPQNIQWYRSDDGGANFTAISGATAPSYGIANTVYPGDNGAVFRAIVSNSLCVATSPNAILTVTPDTAAPTVLSAVAEINPADGLATLVNLIFSEPMDENVINEANFIVFKTGTDPDNPLTPPLLSVSAVLNNRTNVIVTTEERLPLTDYSIRMLDQRDASSGNNATEPNPLTVTLKIDQLLIGFDANNIWKYSIETNLFGSGWETVGYNDSDPVAWPEGPAALGVNTDANPNTIPIRTATAYITQSSAPQFFRRHFFLPSGTNGLKLSMRHLFEDGAVVYINGQEAARVRVAAGALSVTTRTTASYTESSPIEPAILLPTTNVVPGDNVIAVVVIQSGANSTDSLMAMELTATITKFAAGPPTITAQPVGQTVNEGANVSLSVGVDGGVPLYYQWRRNGVDVPGANSSTFGLIGAKPSQTGTYSVFVTNNEGMVTSAGALLTVIPDTTSPTLWGVNVDSNRTQLTLSFSEPLETTSAQTAGNYSIQPLGGSPIAATSAVEANNTNVVLTLASALVDGQSYNVVIQGVVDRAEAAHPVTPKTNGVASLVSLSAGQQWRYNQDGLDLGTAWHGTAFNDSAWSTGAALFDVVRGAVRDTVGGEPVRTELSLTNQLAGDANTNITWYFRTHFNLPVSSNTVPTRVNLFLDDGAVFYINNVEAYRNNITNNPVFYTNVAITAVGTAGRTGPFVVDSSSLVAGDNVLAVEVHQSGVTSSDVTFGAELYALIPGGLPNTPAARLNISYNAATGQTTISWTTAGCTLQEATTLANPSSSTIWANSARANGVPFTPTGSTKFYRLNCP